MREDGGVGARSIAQGAADISMWDAPSTVSVLDEGDQIVVLAGIHVGCWELFVNGRIDTLRDLKGKTVAIWGTGAGDHVLLSSMFAYVGMDPRNAVNWLAGPTATDPMRLFVDGKADAFMGFAPQPSGAACAKNRARHHRHGTGSALVSVLLLHSGSPAGIRPRAPRRQQSGPCGLFSRPLMFARRSPSASRVCSPARASSRATKSGWKSSRVCPTTAGGMPTRRIRSASTPFACTRSG